MATISLFGDLPNTGDFGMAAPRRVIELAFSEEDLVDLARVSRSRTEPASRVERARILLSYRETPSLYATGRAIGVTHQTVERCLRRAQRLGVMAALDDSPRPGREPTITDEARTFIVDLACRKPKELGYPHELWTTRLLTRHVRERAPAAGHACLAELAQGTLCKILAAHEIKPHKVRYYLQRRDPEFAAKMAEVLCVYREVALLKEAAPATSEQGPAVAIISYDEKPGIQALATTAPDLPPEPMRRECVARDHEYVRLGTLSLLAGIDLLTGAVHASVEERHRSREFVAFLEQLDAAYPPSTAIKLVLDNHSAHISKETKAWLATQPDGRFTFVFTPKHGSWLNLVEGFFSKLARSALRHIRVASKQELRRRILDAIDAANRDPVVHTWTYKLDAAA
jgi:transposase